MPINTAVRYCHEPGNFVWPIPFPYGSVNDVGVRLLDEAQAGRRLVYEADYTISDGKVMCIVPPGRQLEIWLDAPYEAAKQAYQANALSASAVNSQNASAVNGQAYSAAGMAQSQQVQSQPYGVMSASLMEEPVACYDGNSQSGACLSEVQVVGSSSAPDNKIASLEQKLDALLDAQAQALAVSQAAEKDGQIAKIRAEGEDCQQSLQKEADACLEAISDKTALATLSLHETASAISATATQAQLQAEVATAAAEEAKETAEDAVKALTAKVAELEARLEIAANQLEAQAAAVQASAINAMQAEAVCYTQAAARATRLAGQAWPTQGYLVQADYMPAGAIICLPEPLAYWPGRNSLYVAKNGFRLSLRRDFEEVGSGNSLSNTIKILAQTNSGDVWDFCIAPTNPAQAASESANAAAKSAFAAARSAEDAAMRLSDVNQVANSALDLGNKKLAEISLASQSDLAAIRKNGQDYVEAIRSLGQNATSQAAEVWGQSVGQIKKEASQSQQAAAKSWQEAQAQIAAARIEALNSAQECKAEAGRRKTAAANSAADAMRLAKCAWSAAWNASLNMARPGIACVRHVSELSAMPSGVYFINKNLAMSLPFMGIWPVADVADMRHDGVFFIGEPYPDTPENPDANPDFPAYPNYPEDPAITPEMRPAAMANGWLPCQHSHS